MSLKMSAGVLCRASCTEVLFINSETLIPNPLEKPPSLGPELFLALAQKVPRCNPRQREDDPRVRHNGIRPMFVGCLFEQGRPLSGPTARCHASWLPHFGQNFGFTDLPRYPLHAGHRQLRNVNTVTLAKATRKIVKNVFAATPIGA